MIAQTHTSATGSGSLAFRSYSIRVSNRSPWLSTSGPGCSSVGAGAAVASPLLATALILLLHSKHLVLGLLDVLELPAQEAPHEQEQPARRDDEVDRHGHVGEALHGVAVQREDELRDLVNERHARQEGAADHCRPERDSLLRKHGFRGPVLRPRHDGITSRHRPPPSAPCAPPPPASPSSRAIARR